MRNRVHRLTGLLKKRYYNRKIDALKHSNARNWWKEIKSLCGYSSTNEINFEHATFKGEKINQSLLPNVINSAIISVSEFIEPIDRLALESLNNEFLCDDKEIFIVSEFDVYMILSKLQVSKASKDDVITNKFLRLFACELSAPLCAVINTSIRTGVVPDQWKIARIALLAKTVPVVHLESDIRPLSITCPISKIAESFIAKRFDDFFYDVQDKNQFGSTTNRSTTLALLKLLHFLFVSSDDSSKIVRVLFVDFKKAFEKINHNVVLSKFKENNAPVSLTVWMINFLNKRKQFVKVGNVMSDVSLIDAGAPQGTKAGPNVFKLLINDLVFKSEFVKYVDDVSVATVSSQPDDVVMLNEIANLIEWCEINGMEINKSKTKEMVIYFGKKYSNLDIKPTFVNDSEIERVFSFKLLGVIVSSDLTWNEHVAYIVSKASRRIFVIQQLLKAGTAIIDILTVYCSIVRSVLEYACQVWHSGLTLQQSKEIESVQRRVMRLILPDVSYKESLQILGIEKLFVRRENLVKSLFKEIKCQSHELHYLLPRRALSKCNDTYNMRQIYPFIVPKCRTNRPLKSCLFYGIRNKF